MSTDILTVTLCVALIALVAVLVPLLFLLKSCLGAIDHLVRTMNRELMPVVGDIRAISSNLVQASDRVRSGAERATRLGEAVGGLGDDLERVRSSVKDTVGEAARVASFWISKINALRSRFGGRVRARKEIGYE